MVVVHTGYENGRPKRQLMTLEEEAQIERNTREASLADTEEHSQGNQHGVRRRNGLQRRREPPRQDHHGDEDVRWDHLPQQRHPLEGNVRDVEGRQSPVVPVVARRIGLEVFVHAGDAGVADVCQGGRDG